MPVLLAACLIALLAAAPAGASVVSSGGFEYVKKTYTPEPNVATTLKAPCPDGTHVWSGGHYNDGTFAEALPRHSFPYDDGDQGRKADDGWGAQVSGLEGVTFTIYATCAAPKPHYEQGTLTAGAQSRTNGVVDCDEGTEAVGGGTRGHRDVTEVGFAPGFGEINWAFGLDNITENPHETRVFAICVERRVVTGTDNEELLPRTQEGHSADCPEGTRIAGGGAGHTGAYLDVVMAATRPQGFGPTGVDGWQVYLDNLSNSATYFFTVVAACVKPLR